MSTQWRVAKGKRETPCCAQQVRVKIVQPGLQTRRCELCHQLNTFVLEELSAIPGTLRLRWLSAGEVTDMKRKHVSDVVDMDVSQL